MFWIYDLVCNLGFFQCIKDIKLYLFLINLNSSIYLYVLAPFFTERFKIFDRHTVVWNPVLFVFYLSTAHFSFNVLPPLNLTKKLLGSGNFLRILPWLHFLLNFSWTKTYCLSLKFSTTFFAALSYQYFCFSLFFKIYSWHFTTLGLNLLLSTNNVLLSSLLWSNWTGLYCSPVIGVFLYASK
jgi:hypothetical protein